MPAPQQQRRPPSGLEIPWDQVDENSGAGVEAGTYLCLIQSIINDQTAGGKDCWIITFKVLPNKATKKHTNKTIKVWCTLGSDDDPLAQDIETVKNSMGIGILKKVFRKAKVVVQGKTAKIAVFARAAQNKQVVVYGQMKKDKTNTPRFNAQDYFEVGEREPEIEAADMDDGGRITTKRKAPTATDEQVEEEAPAEEALEGEESSAPVDESELEASGEAEEAAAESEAEEQLPAEEEEVPEEAPAPKRAAAPVTAKGKVTPIKAATKPAAAPGGKIPTIVCGICSKAIPRNKYKDHVDTCEG